MQIIKTPVVYYSLTKGYDNKKIAEKLILQKQIGSFL